MAMNMPTHIMAKPIQVRIMVLPAGTASAGPKVPQPEQRRVFGANANRQYCGICNRKSQRVPRQAKTEWQHGDFADHHT